MIAARFRAIGWVAGVATAALGCYLVSLQVAAERAELTRTEHRLLTARKDIRSLGTELDTRSRLVQLERWNANVLALTAPKASQYLTGEMQLASLAVPAHAPAGADTQLPPDIRALQAPPAVAQVSYRVTKAARPASKLLHSVSLSLDDSAGRQPLLRPATLVRTVGDDGGLGADPRQVAFLDAGAKSPRP